MVVFIALTMWKFKENIDYFKLVRKYCHQGQPQGIVGALLQNSLIASSSLYIFLKTLP